VIKGTGILAEIVEYRNNIGFRANINAFNTCTNTATVFSNGKEIYLQNGLAISQVVLEPEIDCEQIYVDSWQVLRKLAKC